MWSPTACRCNGAAGWPRRGERVLGGALQGIAWRRGALAAVASPPVSGCVVRMSLQVCSVCVRGVFSFGEARALPVEAAWRLGQASHVCRRPFIDSVTSTGEPFRERRAGHECDAGTKRQAATLRLEYAPRATPGAARTLTSGPRRGPVHLVSTPASLAADHPLQMAGLPTEVALKPALAAFSVTPITLRLQSGLRFAALVALERHAPPHRGQPPSTQTTTATYARPERGCVLPLRQLHACQRFRLCVVR